MTYIDNIALGAIDKENKTVTLIVDVSEVEDCYNCNFWSDEMEQCLIGESFDCPIKEIIGRGD